MKPKMKERISTEHKNGVFSSHRHSVEKQEEVEELELDRSRRGSTALCRETLANLSTSGNMTRLWPRKREKQGENIESPLLTPKRKRDKDR